MSNTQSEELAEEVQLSDNECCIVLDLGCYFPYSNAEILTFDFSLGKKTIDNCKINHRYPNKGYQTISRKYGKRVSKVGYPYVMRLAEQEQPFPFCVRTGIKDECVTLVFYVQTAMTKEKPVCGLSLHYFFEKGIVQLVSCEKSDAGGWFTHDWTNRAGENAERNENDVLLTPQKVDKDNGLITFADIIKPCPSALEDFIVL